MNEKIVSPLFTVEEENLICVYDTSSRAALIENISAAIPHFDEPDMAEIAVSTLQKLNGITDAEYAELTFNPAYHGDLEPGEDDSGGEPVLMELITNGAGV
jgi:hypothetical protein